MSRKKIVALIMGALLAVGIIGGTLAYFKSQDMVPNKFATTGDKDNDKPDVKVTENFDPEKKADKVEPGTTITKHIQIANKDKYKQLVRVKFEVRLLDANGNELDEKAEVNTYKYKSETGALTKEKTTITAEDVKKNLIATFVGDEGDPDKTANINKIVHNISDASKISEYSWYNKDTVNTLDSQYYYLGYVDTVENDKHYTEDLLKSVQLSPTAGIEFKNIKYEVKVIADGVQASNEAFSSVFGITDENSDLYKALKVAQDKNGSVTNKKDIPAVTEDTSKG